MNSYFKDGLKLFGRMILIGVLSFFVVISISAIAIAAFADDVGYIAYGTKGESGSSEELYTYYTADGVDKKLAEYEAQGYTVTKSNIKKIADGKNKVCLIVSQMFTLGILISFIYPDLWDKGNRDNNMVKIGKLPEDKLKGLKIGLLGSIPAILLFVLSAVGKSTYSAEFSIPLYRILNSPFHSVIGIITGECMIFSDLSLGQILLILPTLAVVPIVAHIGYYLGYKDIALGEKFTYKTKNKRK